MSDGAAISRPGLIASESSTKWYEGAGVLEAAMGVKDGLASGGYWSAAGNGAVVGLSALSAVMDPFQVIFAAGVGWLMEHVAILREPLDWLAGDPKEIEGHAATWRNLQQRTYDATEYFADQVTRATADWVRWPWTPTGRRPGRWQRALLHWGRWPTQWPRPQCLPDR